MNLDLTEDGTHLYWFSNRYTAEGKPVSLRDTGGIFPEENSKGEEEEREEVTVQGKD